MNEWGNFFFAEVGASSALAGLVFVGVSINLSKIMNIPGLPERALEALIALITVLVISSLLLVPGQEAITVGLELLIGGAVGWVFVVLVQRSGFRVTALEYRRHFPRRIILGQLAALPFVIAGVAVLAWGFGGLYWVVPG